MSYSIRLSKQVQRQIARLPGDVRNQAKHRIVALRNQPRPADAKELEGHADFFHIWLGNNFRLVWHVEEDTQIVDVFYVGPKSDELYEKLGLARP